MEMEESNEEMFVDGKGCRISVEIRMNNSLIGNLVFGYRYFCEEIKPRCRR